LTGRNLAFAWVAVLIVLVPCAVLGIGVATGVFPFPPRSEAETIASLIRSIDGPAINRLAPCKRSKIGKPYPKPQARLVDIGAPAVSSIVDCYEHPFDTKHVSVSLLQKVCLDSLCSIGTRAAFQWLGGRMEKSNDPIEAAKLISAVRYRREEFELDVPVEFLESLLKVGYSWPSVSQSAVDLFKELCGADEFKTKDTIQVLETWLVENKRSLRWDKRTASFKKSP
jgi:hypothetical protein